MLLLLVEPLFPGSASCTGVCVDHTGLGSWNRLLRVVDDAPSLAESDNAFDNGFNFRPALKWSESWTR